MSKNQQPLGQKSFKKAFNIEEYYDEDKENINPNRSIYCSLVNEEIVYTNDPSNSNEESHSINVEIIGNN